MQKLLSKGITESPWIFFQINKANHTSRQYHISVIEDVTSMIQGPSQHNPLQYVMAALTDLLDIFLAAIKNLTHGTHISYFIPWYFRKIILSEGIYCDLYKMKWNIITFNPPTLLGWCHAHCFLQIGVHVPPDL